MGDRYIIDFQAETKKAEADLKRLINRVEELDRIGQQASNGFLEGTDVNIAKANKKYKDLTAEVDRLTSKMKSLQEEANALGDSGASSKLASDLAKVAMAQANASKSYKMATDELKASHDAMVAQAEAIEKYRESLKGAKEEAIDMKVASKELNKVINQTTTAMGKVQRGTTLSGTDARNYTEGRKYYNELSRQKPDLDNKVVGYNNQLTSIDKQRKELIADSSMDKKERSMKLAMLDEERTAIKERVKATRKLTKAIEDAEAMYKTIDGGGSSGGNGGGGGFDYSGMGNVGGGGGGGRLGKLAGAFALFQGAKGIMSGANKYLDQGRAYNLDMGRQAMYVARSTGDYDERGIRKEAMKFGAQKGINLTGTDVLDYYATSIEGVGGRDRNKTSLMAQELARNSRGVNVDKSQYSEVMGDAMRSGAIDTSKDVSDITKAIQGGLVNSGMVGRDKESLNALNQIAKQRGEGREVTKDDYKDLIAMQTILASTGSKALQGENGAKAIGNADDAIKNGGNFIDFALGKGDKYRGLSGMFDLRQLKEQGFTTETAETIMSSIDKMFPNVGKKGKSEVLSQAMGLNSNVSSSLWDLYESGDFSKDSVQKILDSAEESGDKNIKANKKAYEDSSVAKKENTDVNKARQNSETDDSAMGRTKEGLSNMMSHINGPLAMMSNMAIGATATTLMSRGLSGGIGGFFGKGGTGAGGGLEGAVGASGRFSKMFGSGGSKVAGMAKGFGKDVAEGASWMKPNPDSFLGKAGSKMFNMGESVGKGAKSFASTATKEAPGMLSKGAEASKGLLSKAGKGLGKIAVPLGAMMSVGNIISSDDKARTIGEEGGAWAGAGAGAMAGAGIGSIVPGIGTAIGGAVGGIIGGIGGSSLGGGIVDFFRGGKKGKNSSDGGQSDSESKAKADKRDSAERRRSDNVKKDSENLDRYEALLQKGGLSLGGGSILPKKGYSDDAKSRNGGGSSDDEESKDKDSKATTKTSTTSRATGPVVTPTSRATPVATSGQGTVINVNVTGGGTDEDAKRTGRIIGDEINKRTQEVLNTGGKAMRRV